MVCICYFGYILRDQMRDQFKKKEPIMLSFGIKRKDIIGIVRALVIALNAKGADVIVVGQTLRDKETPRLSFMKADLSSMNGALTVAK
jgi:5-enolpyruvylshikimate-3-phosphate synthase|tara:strand:+ start:10187 stop:10450 length:264 start_codon:yes stop_codon:yes gene_type:complete